MLFSTFLCQFLLKTVLILQHFLQKKGKCDMKRFIGILLVVLLVCLSFAACSKPASDPNADNDNNKNDSSVSDITEGQADAVIDADDIFGNNSSESGNSNSSGSNSSGSSQSNSSDSSASSDSNSSSGGTSDSSNSGSSTSSSDDSSGSSSIDYEDPNVWTPPVGGQ